MDKTQLLIEFLQIGVVGTGLTLLIEFIKQKFNTTPNQTKSIAVVSSIVLGAGYWFLVDTPLWLPIIGILSSATTIYGLFFRGNEETSEKV